MNNQFINNKQTGFTLIEILISIAIFGLLIFAVIAIYLATNNTQIRTTVSQQLVNDSQYVLEFMVKEIRNNSIVSVNYSDDNTLDSTICNDVINTSAGTPDFNNCIILERASGQTFAFTSYEYTYEDTAVKKLLYVLLDCEDDYLNCVSLNLAAPGTYASILDVELHNINLEDLEFYITPTEDPFAVGGPNQQPKVTIKMTTSYFSAKDIEKVKHTFQTTVSSRIYRR